MVFDGAGAGGGFLNKVRGERVVPGGSRIAGERRWGRRRRALSGVDDKAMAPAPARAPAGGIGRARGAPVARRVRI